MEELDNELDRELENLQNTIEEAYGKIDMALEDFEDFLNEHDIPIQIIEKFAGFYRESDKMCDYVRNELKDDIEDELYGDD